MGMTSSRISFLFFFNDTATTEIYTLSLHDALPISTPSSERDVAVFFARVGVALVIEGAKRGDHPSASVGGFDHRVDVAALGGDKRIGEAVAEFRDFLLAQFLAPGLHGFCQVAFVYDVHRAFRTHDRDLRGGPGEIGVDRKSTRLNSSHGYISYAVFCLKKKKS